MKLFRVTYNTRLVLFVMILQLLLLLALLLSTRSAGLGRNPNHNNHGLDLDDKNSGDGQTSKFNYRLQGRTQTDDDKVVDELEVLEVVEQSPAEDRLFFPPYKFPFWGLPYGIHSKGGFFNPGLFPFVPGGPAFPPFDGIFGGISGPGRFPGPGPTPFQSSSNDTNMNTSSTAPGNHNHNDIDAYSDYYEDDDDGYEYDAEIFGDKAAEMDPKTRKKRWPKRLRNCNCRKQSPKSKCRCRPRPRWMTTTAAPYDSYGPGPGPGPRPGPGPEQAYYHGNRDRHHQEQARVNRHGPEMSNYPKYMKPKYEPRPPDGRPNRYRNQGKRPRMPHQHYNPERPYQAQQHRRRTTTSTTTTTTSTSTTTPAPAPVQHEHKYKYGPQPYNYDDYEDGQSQDYWPDSGPGPGPSYHGEYFQRPRTSHSHSHPYEHQHQHQHPRHYHNPHPYEHEHEPMHMHMAMAMTMKTSTSTPIPETSTSTWTSTPSTTTTTPSPSPSPPCYAYSSSILIPIPCPKTTTTDATTTIEPTTTLTVAPPPPTAAPPHLYHLYPYPYPRPGSMSLSMPGVPEPPQNYYYTQSQSPGGAVLSPYPYGYYDRPNLPTMGSGYPSIASPNEYMVYSQYQTPDQKPPEPERERDYWKDHGSITELQQQGQNQGQQAQNGQYYQNYQQDDAFVSNPYDQVTEKPQTSFDSTSDDPSQIKSNLDASHYAQIQASYRQNQNRYESELRNSVSSSSPIPSVVLDSSSGSSMARRSADQMSSSNNQPNSSSYNGHIHSSSPMHIYFGPHANIYLANAMHVNSKMNGSGFGEPGQRSNLLPAPVYRKVNNTPISTTAADQVGPILASDGNTTSTHRSQYYNGRSINTGHGHEPSMEPEPMQGPAQNSPDDPNLETFISEESRHMNNFFTVFARYDDNAHQYKI